MALMVSAFMDSLYHLAMNSPLKTLLLILVLSVGLVACQLPSTTLPTSSPVALVSPLPTASPVTEVVLTADTDGQTVLDLTKAKTQVAVKEYDFGVMVEGINGQTADAAHFWALYVNGALSQTGAGQTKLKKGDIVKWVFEEVQQ
jgi:hypothetical protein